MLKTGARGSARRSASSQATIKRLADLAGVSIATVSRVSADPRAVSDGLRLRVQEAALNLMTLGTFRALHEAGIRIPEEIAVVGFDDMPWATSLNPPLTVASQPSQEIGLSAADLLLDRIARPDRAIRHLILETKLVVRASCGASLHRARAKASPGHHAIKK